MNIEETYEPESDREKYIYFYEGDVLKDLPHFHHSIEYILVLDGEVKAVVNGEQKYLHKNDIVFVDQLYTHYYNYSNKIKVQVIVLSEEFITTFLNIKENKSIQTYMLNKELNKPLISIIKLWKETRNGDFLLDKGFAEILLSLSLKNYPTTVKKDYKSNDAIRRMLDYINENSSKTITRKMMAKTLGYSEVYCSKLFSKYIKSNFRTYLNKVRLEKAQKLIKDKNYSALDAALECGFNSMNTYYRALKK